MLYIEKSECPDEIRAKISEIQETDKWINIPDPANKDLSQEEKNFATKCLRDCFDLLDKERIRESLLSEQHYLCAYCMRPIKNEGLHTSIEHWVPLSKSKLDTLNYWNFFATCKGGTDVRDIPRRDRILCCDAKKGNDCSITLDPRNKEMMKGITYSSEGIIEYKDTPPFNRASILNDINVVLQLNGKLDKEGFCKQDTATHLVKERRDVYNNTEKICLERLEDGILSIEWLHSQIETCLKQKHREKFAGVEIFVYTMYLEHLEKAAQ